MNRFARKDKQIKAIKQERARMAFAEKMINNNPIKVKNTDVIDIHAMRLIIYNELVLAKQHTISEMLFRGTVITNQTRSSTRLLDDIYANRGKISMLDTIINHLIRMVATTNDHEQSISQTLVGAPFARIPLFSIELSQFVWDLESYDIAANGFIGADHIPAEYTLLCGNNTTLDIFATLKDVVILSYDKFASMVNNRPLVMKCDGMLLTPESQLVQSSIDELYLQYVKRQICEANLYFEPVVRVSNEFDVEDVSFGLHQCNTVARTTDYYNDGSSINEMINGFIESLYTTLPRFETINWSPIRSPFNDNVSTSTGYATSETASTMANYQI